MFIFMEFVTQCQAYVMYLVLEADIRIKEPKSYNFCIWYTGNHKFKPLAYVGCYTKIVSRE